MARQLSTAILRGSSGQSAIDAENGVIRGVKLMELGKVACFAGEDGKPKSVKITESHISALLNHAGNRSIPIHETHEWFSAQGKPNADSVEMAARIGALKAFRRDESGDLIADAYFKEGQKRNDIIWGAEHNPEDNCFSVVFSYLQDDPQCLPQNFRAGDLVPNGAATTALFSENTETSPMDENLISQISALCQSDPHALEAFKALLKSIGKASESDDAPALESAEMEAGVTEEDKKPEDDAKPALMRSALRVHRATLRQAKAIIATEKTAILAEASLKGEASATALLGKGGLLKPKEGDENASAPKEFIEAQMKSGCPNQATAIARMAKDKPELYKVFRA